MPGTLSIIATPIGNLEDVSPRALRTMKESDILYCEDTRVTSKLLARYEMHVPLKSYREHNHESAVREIIALLQDDKKVGYVSDAGTPGIADPGARLVRDILKAAPETVITPIAGPSAVASAMSIAGFPAAAFLFLGFPPHKKGRNGFFDEAMASEHPVVLYESPHRIFKALEAIEERGAARQLCVCRELTKLHETVYRGTAAEVRAMLEAGSAKGEFVIVIEGTK
jgi:16S rRNA (cytidine1402-2'-O)-methyltransferase